MYQKGERRREEILRATLRVIGAHGADAVTHRAVAAEAGVPLSATTYYFASKDELLEQTLLMAAREETERIERLVLDLAPQELSASDWAAAVAAMIAARRARRARPPRRPVRARAWRPPAPSCCAASCSAGRRPTSAWPSWAAARWARTSRSWTRASWWPRSPA